MCELTCELTPLTGPLRSQGRAAPPSPESAKGELRQRIRAPQRARLPQYLRPRADCGIGRSAGPTAPCFSRREPGEAPRPLQANCPAEAIN